MNVLKLESRTDNLQSCLLCRRTITRRESHDRLETIVLESIRAEHPEWEHAAGGANNPYVDYYRAMLTERARRVALARDREESRERRITRISSPFKGLVDSFPALARHVLSRLTPGEFSRAS